MKKDYSINLSSLQKFWVSYKDYFQLPSSEQKEKYELIYSTTNKRKRSERLGINVHSSIPSSISKIHGRKPINRQAARIVGFKFKKK